MKLHVIHARAVAEDGMIHNATYAISELVVEHDLPMVLPNVIEMLDRQVCRSARRPSRDLSWEVFTFEHRSTP